MGSLISRADAELLMALEARSEQRLRQALRDGGDPNCATPAGPALPSFLRAARKTRDDFGGRAVALLTRAGAEVEARAASGMSALHAAAWNADEGAVKALLAAGANPNARSSTGAAALHYVSGGLAPRAGERQADPARAALARSSGFKCALALLEAGADWGAANGQGFLPAETIRGRGWADLASMIEAWAQGRELGSRSGRADGQERPLWAL